MSGKKRYFCLLHIEDSAMKSRGFAPSPPISNNRSFMEAPFNHPICIEIQVA